MVTKVYTYLGDDYHIEKKAKGERNCVIKREMEFQNYKDFVKNNQIVFKSQQRFRSELHNVFTEKVNKVALSVNDSNRKQMSGSIICYPYSIDWEII